MNRSRKFPRWVGLALILLLASVGLAAAQVVPPCTTCPPCPADAICEPCGCVPPPRPIDPPFVGGVSTNPEWLKITTHDVDVAIENQIAHTAIRMEFVNEGFGLAEGTFVFPLPMGAAVDELIMTINDVPIEAQILPADEARAVYDAIVAQYRDPALLEYIGQQLIQANVFPIPPGEKRRIDLSYTQSLEVENGLIHYVYPMDVTRLTSRRPIGSVTITVNGESAAPISSIYSPSHDVAIARDGETGFTVGFERSEYAAEGDFSLYYAVASDRVSANLLTYRAGANEDGYFMLLVEPPLSIPEDEIAARDVIVVLDQSGSMDGAKWQQGREAAIYVLEHLNPQDRFNAILFSTGWRMFSETLESQDVADEAAEWIESQYAEGGTNINDSLLTALDMVDAERPTTIIFLTDGLPTEGATTDPQQIIENVTAALPSNVRIFTFGVGDDVNTVLLDTIAREGRGNTSYVRPTERIDEEMAALVNRIGSPALTDPVITVEGVQIDTLYPQAPLADLFAGTQLAIVGRYRDGAESASITISGRVGNETQTFTFSDLDFRDRAGGEPFIARLWATRRIGELLNEIRLNGEDPELIDSIISLSVRFGIITPYTSFLITEDDILTQSGQAAAAEEFEAVSRDRNQMDSGAAAVTAADAFGGLANARAPMAPMPMATSAPAGTLAIQEGAPIDGVGYSEPVNPIQTVEGKTFLLQDGVWTDTTFEPDTMTTEKVEFLSDAYFDLLTRVPELAPYLAIGEQVIVVWDDVAYQVVA